MVLPLLTIVYIKFKFQAFCVYVCVRQTAEKIISLAAPSSRDMLGLMELKSYFVLLPTFSGDRVGLLTAAIQYFTFTSQLRVVCPTDGAGVPPALRPLY